MGVVNLTTENASLVAEIMEKYRNSVLEKKRYELDVLLNLRYLKGDTHYSVDGMYRIFKEYHAYVHDENILKENYNILDSVRQEYISRLTRTFPLVRSVPDTQDYTTITKALITNKILENVEKITGIKKLYRIFCDAITDTGTCGFIPYWDNSKGDVQTIKVEESEVNGKKFENVIMNKSGDIGIDIIYFWEMYPESVFHVDLSDSNYFIRARGFSLQEIEENYGIRIVPEKIDMFTRQSTTYNVKEIQGNRKLYITDNALLIEYYERPTTEYPNGRFVVICNEKVLHIQNNLPYKVGENGEYNYGILISKFISRTKEFFGDTKLSPTRAVQRNIDGAENLKREMMRSMAIGKWFYEDQSIDDPAELNDISRGAVKVNFGRKAPEQQRANGINGTLFQQLNQTFDLNSYVSGVSSFQLSGNPNSAQRSEGVFTQMGNRNNTSFSGVITNVELFMLDVYKTILRMYKQFAPDRRWFDKYDEHYNMIDFKFADLLEDLSLTNRALVGLTEDEERSLLQGLMELGIFNNEENSAMDVKTKQNVLNLLKLGSISDFVDNPFLNQSRSQDRENEDLIKGTEVEINDYDNHKAHISSMEQLFNSAYFYKLKSEKDNEGIYKTTLKHYNEHVRMLSNEVKSQIVQAQALNEQNKG